MIKLECTLTNAFQKSTTFQDFKVILKMTVVLTTSDSFFPVVALSIVVVPIVPEEKHWENESFLRKTNKRIKKLVLF